jgi:hypothetical protein
VKEMLSTLGVGLSFFVVLIILILVFLAIRQDVKQVEDAEPLKPIPSEEWVRTAYETTTSLYVEVDREIWQISTIFLSASLLLMGWVVTRFGDINLCLTLIVGCASIVLVGVATLFKHRLRAFNLVHVSYLRRLERAIADSEESVSFWGLHYLRRRSMMSKGNFRRKVTSIHGVMDIYFVLFLLLWVGIWLVKLADLAA